MEALPKTRYVRNGETYLAHQELGDGPLATVVIESWVHHVEAFWTVPEIARQRRRLAPIGRLIILDRRGTGLSDPVAPDHLPGTLIRSISGQDLAAVGATMLSRGRPG